MNPQARENSTMRLTIDPTNPGQFFACCGLLELADRMWPGAEGWFEDCVFCIAIGCQETAANNIIKALTEVPELSEGVTKKSALNGSKSKLMPVTLSFPMSKLVIDWWRDGIRSPSKFSSESVASSLFKTWAGQQSPQQIVYESLMPAIYKVIAQSEGEWFHAEVPLSGRFGFDHRASVVPIDAGWSPNDQDFSVATSPTVEFLAMIGLQRFRPLRVERTFNFHYCTWSNPMPCHAAPAYGSGIIQQHGSRSYLFSIEKRGDYKFFSPATPQGASA